MAYAQYAGRPTRANFFHFDRGSFGRLMAECLMLCIGRYPDRTTVRPNIGGMYLCVRACMRVGVWNPWSQSANKHTNLHVTSHGTGVH